jgi:prophage regulatory protein
MHAPDRLIRIRDVAYLVGMSKATIYRKLKSGDFPSPVKVGGPSVRWRESSIAAWIAALTQQVG